MTIFNYIAANQKGKIHKGILQGDSATHIRQLLQERGLTPLKIITSKQETVVQTKPGRRQLLINWQLNRKISLALLTVTTYQFATLLAAGLPVEAALFNIASEIEHSYFKQVLLSVRGKVLEGHSLAAGLQEHPNVFPKLYTASIAVGEKTGQLDKILDRLANYYEKQRAIKEKIVHALIYPSLLTTVAIGMIVFLLVYVIPQITSVFTETGQKLPGITIFLLQLTNSLRNYGLYILFSLLGLLLIYMYASKRSYKFRYSVHRTLLKIPFISTTIIAINAARFLRTLGMLFGAGVPVLDAMTSANRIIECLPMQSAISTAITSVGEGSSIHQALTKTGFFSNLSNQLIASGESGGNLEIMLDRAANFQEQTTATKIAAILAIFEPMLILTMGGIVLFIVLAVLLPIFEMNQLIH